MTKDCMLMESIYTAVMGCGTSKETFNEKGAAKLRTL